MGQLNKQVVRGKMAIIRLRRDRIIIFNLPLVPQETMIGLDFNGLNRLTG